MAVYILRSNAKLSWDILQFELYPPLFTYNVEFFCSSNVNMFEWLVSAPAVQLFF